VREVGLQGLTRSGTAAVGSDELESVGVHELQRRLADHAEARILMPWRFRGELSQGCETVYLVSPNPCGHGLLKDPYEIS
jgi:hypothetical protein